MSVTFYHDEERGVCELAGDGGGKEKRAAELEACLHACDPYEGGQSMCDAALERIAREKDVAAPLTTGKEIADAE